MDTTYLDKERIKSIEFIELKELDELISGMFSKAKKQKAKTQVALDVAISTYKQLKARLEHRDYFDFEIMDECCGDPHANKKVALKKVESLNIKLNLIICDIRYLSELKSNIDVEINDRLTFKAEFEKSHFFDDLDDIFYG